MCFLNGAMNTMEKLDNKDIEKGTRYGHKGTCTGRDGAEKRAGGRGREGGRDGGRGRVGCSLLNYSNNVSCEFDKLKVDTHLCKLRNTPVVRF